ncbi:PREDICTED: pectinesterase-like [Ipomoea nil]|uniref:pectinesterase-like n=1 Tax=Ipomoea nil TaxID=35883 RepID=UPI0009019BB6|nr:PREDICTED: pectinesterase-like [Ipomoea nil]
MISLPPLARVVLLNLMLIGVVVVTAIDLKAICKTTLYPDSCFNRLAPIVDSQVDNVGHHELYRLSIGVAITEVLGVANGFLKLEEEFKNVSDVMSLSALKYCRKMLDTRAVTSLKDCLVTPNNGKPTTERIEDLKTWLTAAGVYHQTCIDAFEEAKDEVLRHAVLEQLKSSIELTSNSLTILYTFEESLASKPRLGMGSSGMSRWISKAERKILETPLKDIHIDIVVAKDGSGNFKTIGDALKVVPTDGTRFVMYVKAGTYYEILKVDSTKSNLIMIGDGMDATIISGNLCKDRGIGSYDTPTIAISGAGFIAKNMGFKNTAGPKMGQAVALRVESDKAVFYQCKIAGYQDTLLAQANRQFFYQCKIYGTIDFIFGYSAAVFKNTQILIRNPAPNMVTVITAQGKYEPAANSGFSFISCTISAAEDIGNCPTFLGRPWKDYSTTVFSYSDMGNLIDPKGWCAFGDKKPDTIYYGEYKNSGPGSPTGQRVRWKGVHSRMRFAEANKFSVDAFIDGGDWIPGTGVPSSIHSRKLLID